MSAGLDPILDWLRGRPELGDYRTQAVAAAVQQRMARLAEDAGSYYGRLVADPGELGALRRVVSVPVTGFFRDPATFDALVEQVLPALAWMGGRQRLRVWTAGVATGEEAWSVAMLLDQAMRAGMIDDFEVLASDHNPQAIAVASAARYPRPTTVPGPLHRRHLVDDGEGVCVADALRARVRFAVHDLGGPSLAPREAVVAHFPLILLRNVMIYFDRALQGRVTARMLEVLPVGGCLVLGALELLAPHPALEPWPGAAPGVFRRRRGPPAAGAP